MLSSFVSDWDLPNWDWLNAYVLSTLRLSIEEEEYFRVLIDFKVPYLDQLLSKEILYSAGLNRFPRVSLGFFIFSFFLVHFLSSSNQSNCKYEAGGCGNDEEGLGPEKKGSGLSFYIEGVKFAEPKSKEALIESDSLEAIEATSEVAVTAPSSSITPSSPIAHHCLSSFCSRTR